MNPTIFTYIGIVVAILILVWGIIEVGRRYGRQRKVPGSKEVNTWVPLKPAPAEDDDDESADEDSEETPGMDPHLRAHQNGHYSESKKMQ